MRVKETMESAVAEGVFPGAVLLIGFKGEIIFLEAYGCRRIHPQEESMYSDTLFDLASLTKALATTPAIMILIQEGKLSQEARAAEYLPLLMGSEAEELTLRHLLSHCAGLPPWQPYYLEMEASGLLGNRERRLAQEWIVRRIAQEKLLFQPGARSQYSDLGFLLLGAVVERVDGRSLDVFCQEEVFRPLGLKAMGFFPIGARAQGPTITPGCWNTLLPLNVAATENCPWRKKVLCGEVHDENAYALGGVAGHAGLFSTAEDVYSLASVLLSAYNRGKGDLFRPAVIRSFFTRQLDIPGSTWALGWDTPSPENSSAGRYFSANSVGHLGYTGTSLWMDLERSLIVILLTNRIHSSRDNDRLKVFRPRIHDRIVEELRPWN